MSSAKPKLLLLPGLDGTGELFAEILPFLSEFDVGVVRYPRDRVMRDAEILEYIRTRLPAAPFFLLAESFSTPFAMQLAAEHPRGLLGLILSVGFATNPANRFERALLSLIAPIAVRLPMSGLATRFFLVNGDEPKRHVQTVQKAVDSVAGHVLLARLRQSIRCDVRPTLAKIDVPVLYLRATRDRLIRARSADEIVRRLPNARVATFDAPHTLLLSRPQEAAAEIMNFAGLVTPNSASLALDKVER